MLSLMCDTHSQPSADDGYYCFAAVAATTAVISQYWCFDNSTEGVKEKVNEVVLLLICYVSLGRLPTFSRPYFPFSVKED